MAKHLADWQTKGWVPDMRIEVGGPPRYEGLSLIRARGWTHWHHLFNPRQLLVAALVNDVSVTRTARFAVTADVERSTPDSVVGAPVSGGGGRVQRRCSITRHLNTLYNYGCRGFAILRRDLLIERADDSSRSISRYCVYRESCRASRSIRARHFHHRIHPMATQ